MKNPKPVAAAADFRKAAGSARLRLARLNGMAVAILVFASTAGLFWPAVRGGYVDLDDRVYVQDNPLVQQGLAPAAVRAAFATVHENTNWIPLTLLSLQLDTALFGPDVRGYHRTNVVLHALNALLVYLLFWRALGSPMAAGLIALLFAWHPLRVESVAWLSERKDVLSAFWGLAAFHAYLAHARRPSWRSLAWVFLGMLASLMSKPMLVTLPFLFLLWDVWPLRRIALAGERSPRRRGRALVLEKTPLFCLSLLFCGLTYATQRTGGALRMAESFGARLLHCGANLAHYLRTVFWPKGLAIVYGAPNELPGGQVLCGFLALGAMIWLAWACARRLPAVAVGLGWFLGLLVPVIGFVPVGAVEVADRYTYLPSIGLALAVVALGRAALGRWRRAPAWILVPAVPALILLALATARQIPVWADSLALYRQAAQTAPRHPIAHDGLGLAWHNAGQPAPALASYDEAIRLDPGYMSAQLHRALLLVEMGRAADALQALAAVWSRIPASRLSAAFNTRAMALDQTGRTAEAATNLLEALKYDPSAREPRMNLGIAYLKTGRTEEALDIFKRVGRDYPNEPDPWIFAGRVLSSTGRPGEAVRCFEAARRLKPNDLGVANLLGVALGRAGQPEQALAVLDAALAADPDNPITLNNCALLLLAPGRTHAGPRALQLAEAAARKTDRREAAILDTLARAYAENGRTDEAIRTADEALKLGPATNASWAVDLRKTQAAWMSMRNAAPPVGTVIANHAPDRR